MLNNNIIAIISSLFFFIIPTPIYARCAICYTNGMSGASIAILVIISSLIFLLIANKLLRKFINKN